MNAARILLHLSLIKGIGPAAINRIAAGLSYDNFDVLYTWQASDFIERCGFSLKQALSVVEGLRQQDLLVQEERVIHKHGIHLLTLANTEYPAWLQQIYLPPPVLYCQGDTTILHKKSLAVVGSRAASSYGRQVIDELVPSLVQASFVIVSGGALGADTMAHQATLAVGGKTIAVLGSGLLHPYPRPNKGLFAQIVSQGGVIMSPFTLNTEPQPGNFPARNRIIAGLSQGCLVVQAAEQSGASITASFALQQGRAVFAIPGQITDPLSTGCNALIKQGAVLVQSVNDILQELGEPLAEQMEQRLITPVERVQEEQTDPILKLCTQPSMAETIAEQLNVSLLEAQNRLFTLQLAGKVTQNFMGLWERA